MLLAIEANDRGDVFLLPEQHQSGRAHKTDLHLEGWKKSHFPRCALFE